MVTSSFIMMTSAITTQGQNGLEPCLDYLCSNWFLNVTGVDFEIERIPDVRNFVGSYYVDVGTCPVGTCPTKTLPDYFEIECPDDGYIVPITETRKVDLGDFGTREYEYVTKCGCQEDTGVRVTVQVLDSETEQPINKVKIFFNGGIAGHAEDGLFSGTVDSNVRSLVVRGQSGGDIAYLEAVKVVDIPEYFRGPVDVVLYMIKKAEPVEINSKKAVKLYLSDNVLAPENGRPFIKIDKGSFETVVIKNGRVKKKLYKGTVKASVTFVDSNTVREDIIPGRFLTPEGDAAENLISDGIVNFEFTTLTGNPLSLKKKVKFTVNSGMRLWNLNSATGLWEPKRASSNRGKRQVTLTDELITEIENGQWVNIDKIPGAPRCYFKGRIFNVTDGTEITSSATTSFRPSILAYTNQNQRLRIYAGSTYTPADTCYEVRCPDVTDPNDALIGFINMTSTEIISIGGTYVPYETVLTPKVLADYTLPIQTQLSAVQYDIHPDQPDVFVNFVSDPAGPFYLNKTDCENTLVNEPAIHFYKPPLPSYEPVPDGTEFCTARIALRDGWNFYNYTTDVTYLPNITAISVWEEDGQDYYYTSVVQVEESTNGGEYFVFACLSYRCSEADEPTTVYLDIQVPNNTYYYNRTGEEGNYTVPEFQCTGECKGPLCNSDRPQDTNNGSTIEGSFIAPDDIDNNGPDFFNSEVNDCDEGTSDEEFAYEFVCYTTSNKS
ncbi:cartilage intermediate layer protein 2 [Mactra antiquata]